MTAHLLLTRFSVRLNEAAPEPDERWLRRRLELFRRFCVPSVRSQTVPPDAWLVLCSPPPDWLTEELERLRREVPCLRPVDVQDAFGPAIAAEAVRPHVPAGAKKLITTRLDNDDAIARSYLGAVREAAHSIDEGFVNFPHGLQLAGGRLYWRADRSNAFISRVETAARPLTVFLDEHQRLDLHGPIVQAAGRDLWLQVVHDENLANTVRGVRVDPRRAESLYAAELDLRAAGRLELAADRARTALRLGLSTLASPHRLRKAWRTFARRRG